jgi:hypothetical protein
MILDTQVVTRTDSNAGCAEHARLKDHISTMEGGLEAKLNEGGKPSDTPTAFLDIIVSRLSPISLSHTHPCSLFIGYYPPRKKTQREASRTNITEGVAVTRYYFVRLQ